MGEFGLFNVSSILSILWLIYLNTLIRVLSLPEHSGIHTVDLSDDRVDYPHEDEIELVGGGLLES